jgi:hypothetical protein
MIGFVPIMKSVKNYLRDANEEMYFEDKLESIQKLEAVYNIQHSLSVGAIDMGFKPPMSQADRRRQ